MGHCEGGLATVGTGLDQVALTRQVAVIPKLPLEWSMFMRMRCVKKQDTDIRNKRLLSLYALLRVIYRTIQVCVSFVIHRI